MTRFLTVAALFLSLLAFMSVSGCEYLEKEDPESKILEPPSVREIIDDAEELSLGPSTCSTGAVLRRTRTWRTCTWTGWTRPAMTGPSRGWRPGWTGRGPGWTRTTTGAGTGWRNAWRGMRVDGFYQRRSIAVCGYGSQV